jgi:hypothetical protein
VLPYTPVMASRSAQAGEQARADRLARMTPAERVDLAFKLGEQGVAEYMVTHGVDRRTAMWTRTCGLMFARCGATCCGAVVGRLRRGGAFSVKRPQSRLTRLTYEMRCVVPEGIDPFTAVRTRSRSSSASS